jgi:hypothetical protein
VLSALPTSIQSLSDDTASGTLWVVTQGSLPDGGQDNGVYVLDDTTLATVADVPLPSSVTADNITWTPYAPSGIIALPGLQKVYIGVQTGPGEIDAIAESGYAVTTVAQLQAMYDFVAAFAYDPVRQLVYASVNSYYQTTFGDPGYVYVIDATNDQLVATLYPFDDSAVATPACSTTATTSCFSNEVSLALDATGRQLYLYGDDQYGVPMAASYVIDGGPAQEVLGGHGGGWTNAASGLATFSDGGAMVAPWLSDGGWALQALGSPPVNVLAIAPDAIAPVDLAGTTCGAGASLSVFATTSVLDAMTLTLYSGTTLDTTLAAFDGANLSGTCDGNKADQILAKMVATGSQTCLLVTLVCRPNSGTSYLQSVLTNHCCP